MADNTQVCPAGTLWQFTFASHTSAQASQISALVISGTTFNISSYATLNITAPRIKIGNLAGIYAYIDAEIINQAPGNMYWNVSSLATRQWTGSIWQDLVVGTGTYLPLTGGTLTGPLNVGTTQFIDSSFYSTFALGCAAAQAANATLLLTKTFTNVPTGTYNCNIAVPVGVRSTSALLQVAAGATLTFTGQYSGPFTPWIDIHTNSGASLVWQSASTLYPDYLGAKGDGSSDDTVYVQEFLTTLLNSNSYESYNTPPGYGVPGENYLVTQPLNATCVDGYKRLSLWNLAITHKVTTGSPGAALDIGGCNSGFYYGLGVSAYGNNPANSPMVTSAILLTNGKWTSGYNAEAGGGSFFDHISACGGYNPATGDGALTASMVVVGADLVTIQNSTLGCNGGGHGSGLVWGVGLGHATAVNSAFYTLNPSPGYPTALYSYNNTIYGDHGPPVQQTGAGVTMNGGYVVSIVTGSGGLASVYALTAGSGQTPGTYTVNATGGAGSGATASVVVGSGGTVSSVTMTNPGWDYTSPPTFTLAAGGTPGTFASFLANGTIDFTPTAGGQTLFCEGLNTEVQSSSAYIGVFEFESGVSGVECTGRFNSPQTYGSLIEIPNPYEAVASLNISNPNGSTAYLFNVAPDTSVGNSVIRAGYNTPLAYSLPGYPNGFTLNGTSIYDPPLSCALMANTFNGVNSLNNQFFGNNGCHVFSSITTVGGGQYSDTYGWGSIMATADVSDAAIANSPYMGVQGVYESASTPTYGADTWKWTDVLGSGVNGTSTLTLTHSGSSGVSGVSVPPVTAGSLSVISGRKGTLQCTSGGAITVSNTNYLAISSVTFSTNTPGGTQTYAPNITASTPGTSFTATCAVGDTTLYNYTIWN